MDVCMFVSMANVLRAQALALRRFSSTYPSFLRFPATAAASFHSSPHAPCSSATPAATTIANRVDLGQDQVVIQGKELAIVQPRDVDQVLDMYIKQGKLEGDPYWCRLWPSAIVLADEILKNPQHVAKLCVCDLGSGLGLAGLAALLAGAKEVVFYDQEPLALLCCLLTVHANIPDATTNLPFFMEHICADKTSEYIEYLTSGLALCPDIFYGRGKSKTVLARAEVFDWSEVRLSCQRFDTVVACDVLYEKRSVSYLAEVLPKLVQPNSGRVIMADPTNRTPQNRLAFLDLMEKSVPNEGLKLKKIVCCESDAKTDYVELMQFCSSGTSDSKV